MPPVDVFLGGSCNPTTWRKTIAAPLLAEAGITFYDPQTDEWSPEMMVAENEAKETAKTRLYVIDGQTRAIASMLEAQEAILDGRRVALVILDVQDETEIEGQIITGRELKDLNRARAYLRGCAERHGATPADGTPDPYTLRTSVEVFPNVSTAIVALSDIYARQAG